MVWSPSPTTTRSGTTVIVASVVGDTGSASICGRGRHVDSMHVDPKMHAETLRKESARLHVTRSLAVCEVRSSSPSPHSWRDRAIDRAPNYSLTLGSSGCFEVRARLL